VEKKLAIGIVVLVSSCLGSSAEAQGAIQLHNGGLWSNYTVVPSVIWTNPSANQEAADDFNVVGTVTRVVANGNGCFQCAPAALAGVWVRFYAWQSGNPGALQYQAFVPAGSAQLQYNPALIEVIDVTLPTPFFATGQHFVSVQASFVVAGYWGLWICDYNAPTGSSVKFRDNLVSPTWGSYSSISVPSLSADLDLELWGYPTTPPSQPTDSCGAWDVVSPAAPANSYHTLLRDLKVFATFDVWVVGDAHVGTIGNLSSLNAAWHWDGLQWTATPMPNPAPGTSTPNNGLYAVDAAASDDVYAAGYQSITVPGGWYGQQIEVLHWNGSQWSVLPNTPLPPTSIGAGVSGAHVKDLDVLGPNDVWFAGFWIDLQPSGFTTLPGLLMHYDGSNFTLTNVPMVVSPSTQGQTFTKIEAITQTDVWAIGYRHGRSTPAVPFGAPLVFHWNGAQWSSLSPPVPTPSVIADVETLGSNDVWLLGYHTPSPGTATPFMVHWNGSGWNMMPAPPGGSSLKAFAANDLYAGGDGVWHFDGASWTAVQTFPSLTSASFATIDGVAPCQLWGGGGQWVVGQAVPFVARQPSVYWHTQQRMGCLPGGNPGVITAITPPRVGTFFSVGLSDPTLGLPLFGNPGLSYWVISATPYSNAGCGFPVAGTGWGGGFGELLVDIAAPVLTSGPLPWNGGASVSSHGVFIPDIPALAGIQVFSQGALADATNPGRIIVTTALDIRVGY
jgi:hypothetical protein